MAPPARVQAETIVPVYFGTDRAPSIENGMFRLTALRGSKFVYGFAEVSIPPTHTVGSVERPSIWKLQFTENPKRDVVLRNIAQLDEAGFFAALRGRVVESSAKKLFLFIHGYNVTFDDAVMRTGQIAYDLAFDGPALLFSWPSAGKLASYFADREAADWAAVDLKDFLEQLASRSGATEIDIIAHSMGNQTLIAALQSIAGRGGSPFREIVLAAPDIDAGIFERLANAISGAARHTTLYASSNDEALKASKAFAGYPRAGDSSESILVLPGIDTIDASLVDTSILGHSYYGSNRTVLFDICGLLAGKTAATREGVRAALFRGKQYWRLAPSGNPGLAHRCG